MKAPRPESMQSVGGENGGPCAEPGDFCIYSPL